MDKMHGRRVAERVFDPMSPSADWYREDKLFQSFSTWRTGASWKHVGRSLHFRLPDFFQFRERTEESLLVCLRCSKCSAVYAGCWKWPRVPDDSNFPDGFHNVVLARASVAGHRWFFATPQVPSMPAYGSIFSNFW